MEIKKILKNQLEKIKPEKETYLEIKKITKEFSLDLERRLKNKKINAQVFLGGSLAKNTLVKKDKYDVDIFVRFDSKFRGKDISLQLGKVLSGAEKVHGSRDYYHLIKNNIIIEIVPVLKIKNPKDAENVTDLSYFHVRYILNKIKKNNKIADEIRLAKTFCYSQNCYGAESYIKGFSGYALELLICHYGSFLKFIKSIADSKEEDKIIIDDSKHYKNRKDLLENINVSKKQGPMILIDPTYKERNALAGLSRETFFAFKNVCKEFIENPSGDFFEKHEVKKDFESDDKIISIKTNKQKGDIAGTKSKKFSKFLLRELSKEFVVNKSGFDYNDRENTAYLYIKTSKKKDETIKGPHITKVENLSNFKKVHQKAFIKDQFAYANIKHNLSYEEWFNKFIKKNKKINKEMSIIEIKKIN